MAHNFTGNPEFLCSACSECMCEDCKSVAEEYEYLATQRKFALMKMQDQIDELNRTIKRQELSITAWKNMAEVGYADTIKAWMEFEVSKTIKAGMKDKK